MASEMILQNNTTIFNEGQTVRLMGIIESGSVMMKRLPPQEGQWKRACCDSCQSSC